jgi:hypothetical protein
MRLRPNNSPTQTTSDRNTRFWRLRLERKTTSSVSVRAGTPRQGPRQLILVAWGLSRSSGRDWESTRTQTTCCSFPRHTLLQGNPSDPIKKMTIRILWEVNGTCKEKNEIRIVFWLFGRRRLSISRLRPSLSVQLLDKGLDVSLNEKALARYRSARQSAQKSANNARNIGRE